MDCFNFKGLWGTLLHVLSYFYTRKCNFIILLYCIVEDVKSWMRGTHEFHEFGVTTKSNDSTLIENIIKVSNHY